MRIDINAQDGGWFMICANLKCNVADMAADVKHTFIFEKRGICDIVLGLMTIKLLS